MLNCYNFVSCRTPSESQKTSKELYQTSPKLEISSKESTPVEVHKVFANNIDEGAWFVCNKVWQLIENPLDESNNLALRERLADLQVISGKYFIEKAIYFLIKHLFVKRQMEKP